MMRTRDGMKLIVDAISRGRKRGITPAAVLVPKRLALSIVDEMCQEPDQPLVDDVLGAVADRIREKYLRLVSEGGYIGQVYSVPMIVADDVVVCSLSKQELTEVAGRLGVSLDEINRDLQRGAA
jgi:hypothetical protein